MYAQSHSEGPNNNWRLFGWMIAIFFALLLLVDKCHSQIVTYVKLDTNLTVDKTNLIEVLAGSCASPDGPDKVTAIVPPDWNWLNTNGYCYTGAPMPAKNITMCFTLTSPGTSVDFNAGFSTNCPGYTINYARLYTCSPGCVLIDGTAIGTTTGLTAGACYTWCISLSGVGPPGCRFTSLCPYYQDMTPLPVKLLDFKCDYYHNSTNLMWSVASEFNVDKYIVECSNDFELWEERYTMAASNGEFTHSYTILGVKNCEYYRLVEKDYNGYTEVLKIINCDNKEVLDVSWKLYTLHGQLISTGKELFNESPEVLGIYLLEQTINGKVSYQKIIK